MRRTTLINLFTAYGLLFTIFCLLFTFTVHAQGIPGGINGITLTASSDNPAPGQTVTITAASYSFDINSATVIWTVGGKQVQKSIGATTLDVTAPALGKKTTVNVTAITPTGGNFSNSVTIGSGSMDMIIETDGYVPPFFMGKTPLVYQNAVTVIAVPHLVNSSGKEYDPATLIYQWKKDDGTVLQSQSGYGKQAITMAGGLIPRPYYLLVTATSRDGSTQGESLTQIAPQSPSITFYNDDPLYGLLFNGAIGNTLYIGAQREAHAFAALFGFNLAYGNSNALAMDWSINGTSHPELAASQSIVMRAPDGISGTSQVSLYVRGVHSILQGGSGAFTTSFNASQSSTSTIPITF
jgi:hypothetical protein